MNDESFKKTLYLILKVVVKYNGFLSQLEIFRDVKEVMQKILKRDNEAGHKSTPGGKDDDFKDILNFVLTILCELDIITQKMENKSFYFKWLGLKGFRKKYLLKLFKSPLSYDLSESFEQKIQIYTRNLLVTAFDKRDQGVTRDKIDEIKSKCGIENQQQKYIDRIHVILTFLDFLIKEGTSTANTNHTGAIFSLTHGNLGSQTFFKINPIYLEEALTTDHNFIEKYHQNFNENLLNLKGYDWIKEINTLLDSSILSHSTKEIEASSKPVVDKEKTVTTAVNNLEKNELEAQKVPYSYYNQESEDCGFALIRGSNWSYYLKKLYCIIGRTPIKNGVLLNSDLIDTDMQNTTWLVDVDLGQNKRISKQHALICYNFNDSGFEIKNLSKKFKIKVNGENLAFGEEAPLTNKSLIQISNQEFYFLLPIS